MGTELHPRRSSPGLQPRFGGSREGISRLRICRATAGAAVVWKANKHVDVPWLGSFGRVGGSWVPRLAGGVRTRALAPVGVPNTGEQWLGQPRPLPTGHCADGTKLPLPIGLTVDIPKPSPCKHMDYPHNPDSMLEKPPEISGRIVTTARGVGGCGGPRGQGDEGVQRQPAPGPRGCSIQSWCE